MITLKCLACIATLVGVLVAISRKLDARAVLATSGLLLGALWHVERTSLVTALKPHPAYLAVMCAFGYAAVIRRHRLHEDLARLVIQWSAVRNSKVIAVFLTAYVAFAISAIVLSANSTVAVVAPIFIPVLVELGVRAEIGAAAILIGSWGGFVNPADTGACAVQAALHNQAYSIPIHHGTASMIALPIGIAMLIAPNGRQWLRGGTSVATSSSRQLVGPGLFVIGLPFVSVLLLEFMLVRAFPHETSFRQSAQDYVLAVSMILGAAVGAVLSRETRGAPLKTRAFEAVGQFLRGGATGFREVVLLVIAAKLLVEPIKLAMSPIATAHPAHLWATAALPSAFIASLSIGSGDAVVATLVGVVVEVWRQGTSVSPAAIAGMVWLACELGRCASPISAATLTAAIETGDSSKCRLIAGRVLVPACGAFVVGCLALRMTLAINTAP